MSPTSFHPDNFKLGELSTSTLIRKAPAMHPQSKLYSRSTGSGGVERNTIVFIVIGIVCLLVILTGFYLVSRPRATSNAPQSGHRQPSSPSASLHPRRDLSERWKIWKTWHHTGRTDPPTTPDTPTSNVSPAAPTITSKIIPVSKPDSKAAPPGESRPSHARRVTSLSVATSFSHSHITDEALNNFRLSAYDLDGDLEAEMLNSARDDVWPGHVLAMEDCCEEISVEETAPIVGGSVAEGNVAVRRGDKLSKGGDYENANGYQNMTSGGDSEVQKDVPGASEVAMERQ